MGRRAGAGTFIGFPSPSRPRREFLVEPSASPPDLQYQPPMMPPPRRRGGISPKQLGPGGRVVHWTAHLRGDPVVSRNAPDSCPVYGVHPDHRPRAHRLSGHDPDLRLGVRGDDGPCGIVLRSDGLDRGWISRGTLGRDTTGMFLFATVFLVVWLVFSWAQYTIFRASISIPGSDRYREESVRTPIGQAPAHRRRSPGRLPRPAHS